MSTNRSISIVIPNYNGKQLLEENIPLVYNAVRACQVEFEIIVSDDASDDESVEFLKSNYPEIIIVTSSKNQGFSKTANAGIFKASKSLVLILNSDVKLSEDYFYYQFKYFESSDTFGVNGRIIGIENDFIQDGAKTQYKFGLKIGANTNVVPSDVNNCWFPTFYLSGANALVDREKLWRLGGFDEIYSPFYGEDLDLSLRAWKVGWKCYYEHNAICRHPNSVTIKKYNKKKAIKKIVYRNRFLMHEIHLQGYRKILWKVWVGFQLLTKIFTRQNEFVEGYFESRKLMNDVRDSRKKMEQMGKVGRILSNKEVFAYIKRKQDQTPYKVVKH